MTALGDLAIFDEFHEKTRREIISGAQTGAFRRGTDAEMGRAHHLA